MKIFILIISFTLSINVIPNYSQGYAYWEDLNTSEKNIFLSTHNINDLALKYYKGESQINDDRETFELLNALVTSDTDLIPLYNYLFNKICSDADGSESEILGSYCLKMIINNPDYVINYFTYNLENDGKDRYYYRIYGNLIGYEMYFKEKGMSDIDFSFEQFKEYLNNHFNNSTTENKHTLRLLYNCISTTLKISFEEYCITKELTIKYINWSIIRNSPIPVSAFWNDNDEPQINNIHIIKIDDPELLKSFNSISDSMTNLKESSGVMDTRISCLIRYKNCSNDTLSFGWTDRMKFNSEDFELDKGVLKLISPFLPEDQLDLIKNGK